MLSPGHFKAKQQMTRSKKTAFVLFLVLGLWVLLELFCRVGVLFLPDEQRKQFLPYEELKKRFLYQPHPYLVYQLTPNFKDGKLSHNRLGYRGKEIATPKPKGLFRIVMMGGSTTYTSEVNDNEQTYPALVEKLLQKRIGRSRVDVVNAGVPDYTSYESLVNLQFRVLNLKPDLLVIYHSHNDFEARVVVPPHKFRCDNTGYRRHWSLPKKPWWDFSLLFRILSLAVRDHLTLNLVVTNLKNYPSQALQKRRLKLNTSRCFRRNLTNIAAVAHANGVGILFATFATHRKFWLPKEHNRVIRDVAQRTKSGFFDFAALMPRGDRYWHDRIHVNEKGARRKAALFADFLWKHYLRRKNPSAPTPRN